MARKSSAVFYILRIVSEKKRGLMKENRKDHADNMEYRGNSTPSCDSLIVESSCGKSSVRNPSRANSYKETKFLKSSRS